MTESDNPNSSQELMQEQVNKIFEFWSGNLKLPTIGPAYAFSKDFTSFANDFATLGKVMIELKSNMDSYWLLLGKAYTRAITDTAEQAPTQITKKDDFEKYRRAAIEAFEENFTDLFTSPEFSEVYGRLLSTQLNLSKVMQNILEKNLKTLNLPTRSEVDEILKDIAELKRDMRDMKRSVEARINDQARIAT
jgi:hypothetical protein